MLAPLLTRVVEAEQGRVLLAKMDTDQNRSTAAAYEVRQNSLL